MLDLVAAGGSRWCPALALDADGAGCGARHAPRRYHRRKPWAPKNDDAHRYRRPVHPLAGSRLAGQRDRRNFLLARRCDSWNRAWSPRSKRAYCGRSSAGCPARATSSMGGSLRVGGLFTDGHRHQGGARMTGASTTTATMRQRWQESRWVLGTPMARPAVRGLDVDRGYIDLLGGIAVSGNWAIAARGHRGRHRQMSTRGTPQPVCHRTRASRWPRSWSLLRADQRTRCSSATPAPGQQGRTFKAVSAHRTRTELVAATRRASTAHHARWRSPDQASQANATFAPLPGDVTHVGYGDVDALAAAVDDHRRGVPGTDHGRAGVVVPRPRVLAAARDITARRGSARCWLDEVQTGLGRTRRSSPTSTTASPGRE